jgi:sRNA-binding carbon storage regulator CsrA
VLIISRKESEAITIEPTDGLDPAVTLRDAFLEGPITIRLVRICGGKVRIAIEAPKQLRIWRGAADQEDPAGTQATEAERPERSARPKRVRAR